MELVEPRSATLMFPIIAGGILKLINIYVYL